MVTYLFWERFCFYWGNIYRTLGIYPSCSLVCLSMCQLLEACFSRSLHDPAMLGIFLRCITLGTSHLFTCCIAVVTHVWSLTSIYLSDHIKLMIRRLWWTCCLLFPIHSALETLTENYLTLERVRSLLIEAVLKQRFNNTSSTSSTLSEKK